MKTALRTGPMVFVLAAVAIAAGCVERVVKIRTDPPGALVLINDEEVGVTPTEFSFLWYGDYDVVIRKPGYQTLKTHQRIRAPWHQFPPLDLVVEHLYPGMIRDVHVWPTFSLQPQEPVAIEESVRRAQELRSRALGDEP
ncbi:MAG: PEGA domain-containing protein [Planctomycetia bacterium]|nr:MAG: PEGA domain-containing protein [Planctomycetia bacterium]